MISTLGRASDEGTVEVDGTPSAVQAVQPSGNNANHWVVVALAKHPASTWLGQLGLVELLMGGIGLLLLELRGPEAALVPCTAAERREHRSSSRAWAIGASCSRRLRPLCRLCAWAAALVAMFGPGRVQELQRQLRPPRGRRAARPEAGATCVIARELGTPYRLGGDEFCVIARLDGEHADSVLTAAERALRNAAGAWPSRVVWVGGGAPRARRREGARCTSPASAVCEQAGGSASASRQATDVVVKLLGSHPDLAEHIDEVIRADGRGRSQAGAASVSPVDSSANRPP